jgi:hypothetical protein
MDMDCAEADGVINACVARGALPDAALAHHLASCDACRECYDDARLALALAGETIPTPRPGFVDVAIATAVRSAGVPTRRVAAIAAAVAVIGIAIGVVVGARWQAVPAPETIMAQVQLARGGNTTVRLLIDSPVVQEHATLAIELADNIELAGFANQRHIEWQTQLKAGKNLLALPLQLTDTGDSHFDVAVSYGATRKTLRVDVRPQPVDTERGAA